MRRPKGIKTKKSAAKRFKITASGQGPALQRRAAALVPDQEPQTPPRICAAPASCTRPTSIASSKACRSATEACDQLSTFSLSTRLMRVTNAPASRKRRTRMIRAAKGFRMRRSKLYRYASDAVDHGRAYAYPRPQDQEAQLSGRSGRSASTPPPAPPGTTYSRFMEGLKAAKVALDRKILADIAATDARRVYGIGQDRPGRVEDQSREGLSFRLPRLYQPIGERAKTAMLAPFSLHVL